MKNTSRRILRGAGWIALEKQGYKVEDLGGAGILPGARLRATDRAGATTTYAVRTSENRSLSFSYSEPKRQWRTLVNVDAVIICSASMIPSTANVIAVDAVRLHGILEKLRKPPKKRTVAKKPEQLVVPLDGSDDGALASPSLVECAMWSEKILLDDVNKRVNEGSINIHAGKGEKDYIESAREKFADQNKIDVDRVVVMFQILPPKN